MLLLFLCMKFTILSKEVTMNLTSTCKQCHKPIDTEMAVAVCSNCGWSDKKSEKLFDRKSYRIFAVVSILLSILLVTTYYYTLFWGSFSLQTAPLQIKGILKKITPTELAQLADICHKRQNQQCRIKTLSEIIKLEPENQDRWGNLANAYRQNKKYDYAIDSYARYFGLDGKDLMHAYNYAHLLSEDGKYDDAKKYYEYVLQAKPETLQITIAREYVETLMKMEANDEALAFLNQTRASGDNAKFFMDKEYEILTKVK